MKRFNLRTSRLQAVVDVVFGAAASTLLSVTMLLLPLRASSRRHHR
jgi:hypothetical protein